jgi:hypothetical protein
MSDCQIYNTKPENKDPNFKLKPRQDLCIHRFDEFSSTNGILLLHNVGSGKTITSLTLAINSLNWDIDMRYQENANKRTILIVHPTGLFDEFMGEIQSKLLNITKTNLPCVNDRTTGVRKYQFQKTLTNPANNRNRNSTKIFYIESIQYNELAKFFNKYDESIGTIRSIFRDRIVIIDEAHRLFRQFDICDPNSMIISKYINDNLMSGAQKIIAMTGTPLKNNISDMLSLFRFINLANISNVVINNPLEKQYLTRKFDIANKLTYKALVQTRKKIIDPSYWSAAKVCMQRVSMAFFDFIYAERTDLSKEFPNYTDSYLKSCAKINFEVKRKGEIVSRLQYVVYLVRDVFNTPNSTISEYYKEETERIIKEITPVPPQRAGNRRNNKTKKMKGGNITSLSEAQTILGIQQDLSTMSSSEIRDEYIKLSLQYHPDRCPPQNKELCKQKFQQINEAYQFIQKSKSGEDTSENDENFNIQDYYSQVAKFSIFQALTEWTNEEITEFSQNMSYLIKNNKFEYISLDDLITEFAVAEPIDYSDILVSNINELKGLKRDYFDSFLQNYENIDENFFKVYFKIDYELFDNLYVKETVFLIEEPTQTPPENNTDTESKTNTDTESKTNTNTESKTDSDTNTDINSDEQPIQQSQTNLEQKGGDDNDLMEKDILYSDMPNEINFSIFLNKIKNNKDNNEELEKIIGTISPETMQTIQKNLPYIKNIINDTKAPLDNLKNALNLMIEQGDSQEQNDEQKGGVLGGLTLVFFTAKIGIRVLDDLGISLNNLESAFEQSGTLYKIASFLISLFQFFTDIEGFISTLITQTLKGNIINLQNLMLLIEKIIELIKSMPGSETIFAAFGICLNLLIEYKMYIGALIILIGVPPFLAWYNYNTDIWVLEKKSWFKTIYKSTKKRIRQIQKFASFYRSTPDNIALFNISEKNNWIRKRNSLQQDLDSKNSFFDLDYDKIVELTSPLLSTISVSMPSIKSENYNKLLNTNLYTIENIYKKNPQLLFTNEPTYNYPEKTVVVINLIYDYYQIYTYNQFKSILPGLNDNKSIQYINNFIPWYLNKKLLLNNKILGNVSKDLDYSFSTFIDSTRPIVYFDASNQDYELNLSDEKINSVNTGIEIKIYKNINEISFECPKFRKILNYLILMKTGYMVDSTNDAMNIIPQAHLPLQPITTVNFRDFTGYQEVNKITAQTTQYFLPFVYSTSDEVGLNLFAYFLKKNGYKYKVLHELTKNESITKDETIRKSYPIINLEGNNENKQLLANFFVNNIIYDLNDKTFETALGDSLKAEPICVLLHPFKTEGIDAKYNPAIFLMEPALNFGDYEQLCGRVLRTYNPPYNAQPKKMVYQFLTSSNQSLTKFYDDYIYLQRDVNLIKEDIFSVSDFFYVKNNIEITDPYDETNLRTGFLTPYLNNRVNMTIAQIDEKIGNITPTVGSIAATGAAILYSYPKPVIALAASPLITAAAKSTIPTVRGKKITLNGLVPKFTLEHSVIAEAFNMGFNFKNTVTIENNINSNKFSYLKKNIENLDKVLKDLTEGVSVDKMDYLQNKLEKINYDFYSLLDNFICKANDVIYINDPTNNAFTNLRVQLERVYSNNNFFKSISTSIPYLQNKYQMISDLNFKCIKFEYSKLIFNDVCKYLSVFKEVSDIQSQDNYNLSILLDLIKILNVIPDIDDMEKNISDIGSDIYSFLKIKHTEYIFKNILVKRYEDNGPNTIPDLDFIIKTVNDIPTPELKQKVELMPWCNTISNDKYNLCKSLNNIFLSSGDYNLNLNVQEIQQKSDQIINEIVTSGNNNETPNLIALKEELQVLYRNSFTLRNEQDNEEEANPQQANPQQANPQQANPPQAGGIIKSQVNVNVKRKKTIKKNRKKLNKTIKRYYD